MNNRRKADTMPKPAFDWEELDALVKAPLPIEIKGFTSIEYAKRYNISRTAAEARIKRDINYGKLVFLGKLPRVNASGQVIKANCYDINRPNAKPTTPIPAPTPVDGRRRRR